MGAAHAGECLRRLHRERVEPAGTPCSTPRRRGRSLCACMPPPARGSRGASARARGWSELGKRDRHSRSAAKLLAHLELRGGLVEVRRVRNRARARGRRARRRRLLGAGVAKRSRRRRAFEGRPAPRASRRDRACPVAGCPSASGSPPRSVRPRAGRGARAPARSRSGATPSCARACRATRPRRARRSARSPAGKPSASACLDCAWEANKPPSVSALSQSSSARSDSTCARRPREDVIAAAVPRRNRDRARACARRDAMPCLGLRVVASDRRHRRPRISVINGRKPKTPSAFVETGEAFGGSRHFAPRAPRRD